jgi:hypothetical protein
MYYGSVENLLTAIAHDRNVTTKFEQHAQRDGVIIHTVTAQSQDGEVWRSRHTDLLLAVVMLERLIKQTRCDDLQSSVDCSRAWI